MNNKLLAITKINNADKPSKVLALSPIAFNIVSQQNLRPWFPAISSLRINIMLKSYYTERPVPQQGKTFLPYDILILGSGFTLILLGALLYHYNPLASLSLRNLEVVAKINRLEFDSKRKIPGTLSWIDTHANDVLYNGDQILTDEKSTVLVKFDSGSQLLVGPQSLIRVEVVSNEYQIQLIKGQLSIEEGSDKFPTKIIHSETGQALVLKRGDEVITSKDGFSKKGQTPGFLENGDFNFLKPLRQGHVIDPNTTEVINLDLTQPQSGTLALYNADGVKVYETMLSNSPSTIIPVPTPGRYTARLLNPEGKLIGKNDFKVSAYSAPQILLNLKRNAYKGEKIPVKWSGRAGLNYVVRTTTPQGTTEQIITEPVFSISANESGTYAVQVSLLDGKNEYKGQLNSVDVKVIEGLLIPSEQLSQTIPEKTPAILQVQNEEKDKTLVFEVSPQEDFTVISKTVPSKDYTGSIPMDTPGIYYVRARTVGSPPLYSPPAKIVVNTPVVTVNKSYQTKQAITETSKTAILKWEKSSAIKELKLQVAKDAAFNEVIFEKTTNANSATVELPKIGSYFWRALPLDEAPEFVAKSETVPLDMDLPPPLTIPQIIPQQIIHYEDVDGVPSYRIQVFPYDNAKMYYIEIFSDPNAKKMVWKKSSSSPVVYWISSRTGKYYYRVKVQDGWGRISNYSILGELVFPISPMVEL